MYAQPLQRPGREGEPELGRVTQKQTHVFVLETNCQVQILLIPPSRFQMCVQTKYRASLSVVFHPLSGKNTSTHLLMLLWESWKIMCVKCLAQCLACRKHSTERREGKQGGRKERKRGREEGKERRERNKEIGLWSQNSLVLSPSCATTWQVFQLTWDVTVRIQRENSWKPLDWWVPSTEPTSSNQGLLFLLGL